MEKVHQDYENGHETLSAGTAVVFLVNTSTWEFFFFLFGFQLCFKLAIFATIVICYIKHSWQQATFILEKRVVQLENDFSFLFEK